MDREKVKNILYFYRDIDGEIKYNSKIIQDYEDEYYTAGGGTLDGMPNNKYKKSSSVEKIALEIPDFVSVRIQELQAENERLGKLKIAISQEIGKLKLRQKSIVYDFYIQGLQWVQISARRFYSDRQCRNIRNRGLDNLAKIFSKNPLINNYNYPV